MATRMAVVLTIGAGAAWALPAPAAFAHAVLVASAPPEGGELTRPPDEVRITFSEPPDPGLSTIRVLDAGGGEVQSGPATVPEDPLQLRVALRTVPDGVYTVSWRVLSRTDGHVTAGTFAFGVGVSPLVAPVPTDGGRGLQSEPASPVAVAARWAVYAGLALLLGAAVVGAAVSTLRPRTYGPLLAAAWILAAAGLVGLALSQRAKVGVSLGAFMVSGPGRHVVAMAVALAVVGVAVALVARRRGTTGLLVLGLAVAGALVVHVLGGHANAPSPLRPVNLAVQWLHMVAVGVWIGGLAWLLLSLRGRERGTRLEPVRRFSFLAGIALAVVAGTGVLRMLDEVGGPGDWARLFATGFGVAVVVKLALFAALATLGARNRYVNIPGIDRGTRSVGSLRRTVTAELAIAAAVFGATGVMTELPPADVAASSEAAEAPRPLIVAGSDFATTTRVRLTVTPGLVGVNLFEALVTDFDSGRPVDAHGVSLRFAFAGGGAVEPSELDLERMPDGRWTGQGSNLSLLGTWAVSVLVQRAADSVVVDLEVAPRPPPQRIEVAEIPGQPAVYTIFLPGGTSVQGYVDPGSEGVNQVHFTFFDAAGDELPVESVEITAGSPHGPPAALAAEQLSPGHVVGQAELHQGKWRFAVRAVGDDGLVLSASFEEAIRGG